MSNKVYMVGGNQASEFTAKIQLETQGYAVFGEVYNVKPDLKNRLVSFARKANYLLLLPGWEQDADAQFFAFVSISLGTPVWECQEAGVFFEFRLADIRFELTPQRVVENNALEDLLNDLKTPVGQSYLKGSGEPETGC